jgi:hypothetical protein
MGNEPTPGRNTEMGTAGKQQNRQNTKMLTMHYLLVNLAKFFNLPKVKRHI